MSLVSQKDREMVIEALDYYIDGISQRPGPVDQSEINSYTTLKKWIELEHSKYRTRTA